MGDSRAEGSSAIGNGGNASISHMFDIDGTGSVSLLEPVAFPSLKVYNLKVHMQGTYCVCYSGLILRLDRLL